MKTKTNVTQPVSRVRYTHFLLPLLIPLFLLPFSGSAQCGVDTNILRQHLNQQNVGYRCALGKTYMLNKQIPSADSTAAAIPAPSTFPAAAIKTCGRFTFYYDDIALSLGIGYDASGGLGSLRQDNLCAVVAYLESVFDFSKVPAGGIRIHVERSDWHSYLYPGTSGSAGMPFFNAPAPGYPTIKGFVADYAQSGTDPTSGGHFHGQLGIDFSAPSLNSDASVTAACAIDLYTMHLHEMCHVLGFFSFIDPASAGSFTTVPGIPAFSKIDRSLHASPHPYLSSTPPLSSLTPLVTGSPAFSTVPHAGLLWLNGKQAPKNECVEFTFAVSLGPTCPVYKSDFIDNGLHINEGPLTYPFAQRLSPGDQESYVLGPRFYEGEFRRTLVKGEIEAFVDILGYGYNPAYATANATTISNNRPHSLKMASVAYSKTYENATTPEAIAADYSMTNNAGSSLTIDLGTLGSDLVDADGDALSVFPGSLVNFRGCGDGNSHSKLVLSNSDKTITYTPGPNFYGRAQFGFNLYDQKEKGGFVIFTIDVARGTNISLPANGDMVLNGSFEQGSEVRVTGSAASENINNAMSYDGSKSCRISSLGAHLADSHPWDCWTNNYYGHSIYQAAGSCASSSAYPSFLPEHFAAPRGSFYPYSEPGVVDYPAASPGGGYRYQPMAGDKGLMLYLAHCLKSCKTYRLSFWGRRAAYYTGYPAKEEIRFGFLNDAHLAATLAVGAPLLPLPFSPTASHGTAKKAFSMSLWEKSEITFNYCGSDSLNILYLNVFDHYLSPPSFIIDSISLMEILPALTTVSIAQKNVPGSACQRLLEATPVVEADAGFGCGAGAFGFNYSWTKSGSTTVLGTGATLAVEPTEPTTYTVSVDDGCGHSAVESITVSPCKCAPYVVFGNTTAYTTLSGTLPATLAPGLYYAATDLNVSSSSTFNNAVVLMNPGVAIFVNNTAKLTLDSTHLFTCPDTNRLWAGIRLQSVGSSSGRIEVRNGSLIEDAYYAILAPNIKAPPSGNIIDISNSTFNRNWIGLSVNGAYTLGSAGTYPIKVQNTLFTARHFDTMAGYPLRWAPNVRLREELYTVTDTKAPYKINRDYAKAYLKNDTMAYMGIEFHNTGNTLVPGSSYAEVLVGEPNFAANRNIIDNMNYGFHSNNSNAVLVNTHIINIGKRMYPDDDTSHSYPSSAGWGIIGRSTGTRTNRVKVGAGANAGVKLYDCFTGIYMDDVADVDIKAVAIGSSHTEGAAVPGAARSSETYAGYGIQLIGNRNHLKWGITQDTISNIHTGIYLWLGNPVAGATTEIRNNMLYDQNRSARFSGLTAGQYVMNALVADGPGYSPVSTLGIVTNTLDGVYNGILLNSLRSAKPLVDNNTIVLRDKTMTDIGTPQYGISVQNCQDGAISGNSISTPTLGSAAYAVYMNGVRASSNTLTKICGNTTSRIGSAFVFDGKTAQTGTRWIGNTINDGWRGMTLGSDIGDQGFMYNWVTLSPRTFYGAIRDKWIGFGGVKYHTYVDGVTKSMNSKLYVKNGMTPVELPTSNFTFIPGNEYTYTGTTGSILLATATQWDANCIGAIVPVQPPSGPVVPHGLMTLGRLLLTDSLGYDSSYRRSQWMGQLSLYELGLSEPWLRDSVGFFDTFMIRAAGSRFAWLANLQAALAASDTAAAQSLLATYPTAAGRLAYNDGLVITDYTEADPVVAHYHAYCSAYLRFLKGSLSAADTALLDTLARKCPARDGAVVYQARTLYGLLSQTVRGYNDEGCGNGGSTGLYRIAPSPEGEALTAGNEAVYLFPNPNEGSFSIRQQQPEDKTAAFKIYNAQGREIQRGTARFTAGMATFKLQNAVPGLYLICLTEGQKTSCLKFNVR